MAVTAKRYPLPSFVPLFAPAQRRPIVSTAKFGVPVPDELIGLLSTSDERISSFVKRYDNGDEPDRFWIAISITMQPARVVDWGNNRGTVERSGFTIAIRTGRDLYLDKKPVLSFHLTNAEDAQRMREVKGFVALPEWLNYMIDQSWAGAESGMLERHAKRVVRADGRQLDLGD